MCEWLSSGEWCDVQIFCGDRMFNAHRAVLASVSTFLRRTLIACPVEETPTYIFLPDFDGEVFSSILYYIYNGEVIIQKQNLPTFIDIIKVLEIFVDHQSLEKIRIGLGDCNLDLCTYHEMQCSQNNNVFAMSPCSNKNQKYVNIRKGIRNQDIYLQYSHGDSDFRDKQTRCNNWIELQPSLENLQLPYADRQRNSFLRDVFAETYPRNGNANGLKASVPAISNEHYRGPTSGFLTNANGKHPRADNALSEISTRMSEKKICMNTEECKQNIENRYTVVQNVSDQFSESIYLPKRNPNFHPNEILKKVYPNIPSLHTTKLPINWVSSEYSIKNSDIDQTPILALSVQISQKNTIDNSEKHIRNHTADEDVHIESVNKPVRTTIFNHVLENPWCPRLPKCYRQFSNKNENVTVNKKNDIIINDDNNNIQPPAITSVDKIEKEDLKRSDEFKCDICKQVFTSSEDLTVHGRRHSSTGRYACGECGKTFSQLRNFKYHMSVHRGTREYAATCTVCGKYFNDRGYLSSHMKIHRNRKEYKCSLCPKSFNQRVAYNMHVRIHTGIKPHVCEECGKAFSRKMLLKQHQRTHSGERPYACPHCDKRFADRSNMTLHLRLHTGVKPFSCSLCPKSFTKKHHLKSHLNFHTGAKPYSCPRCKLAFTQSSNMRTHLKKCSAPEQILKAT